MVQRGHPFTAQYRRLKRQRNGWFACYAWPERYRTTNDRETFWGRLRTRQRQIHGRKSVQEFILRYGEGAVFI